MIQLIEYLYEKCYRSELTHDEIEKRIRSVEKADEERKRLTEIIAAMPKYQKKKLLKTN